MKPKTPPPLPPPDTTPEQVRTVVSNRADEIRAKLNAERIKKGLKPVSNTEAIVPQAQPQPRTSEQAKMILGGAVVGGGAIGFLATRTILGGLILPALVGVGTAGVSAYFANTMFAENNVPLLKQAYPKTGEAVETIEQEIARLQSEYESLKEAQRTCTDCRAINKRILDLSNLLSPKASA